MPKFLTAEQLSKRLKVHEVTLARWRTHKQKPGPKYHRIGGRIRYYVQDVINYERRGEEAK